MAPLLTVWTRIVYVFDFLSGSTSPSNIADGSLSLQLPVPEVVHAPPRPTKYPTFDPPDDLEPLPFRCEYPDYPEKDGWVACNTNSDRQCWLKNTKTGQKFDIHTDYENSGPRGIVRKYYLELTETTKNPDGVGEVPVQLFNGSFPGPRLQACWGDQLQITIKNKLAENGTTIHWHGLRQLNTSQMDGVNGVTQCPIAPDEEFTYVFNVSQYGTTWYHSHYSLQYAAGLLGPMTIYGPTSRNFDHQLYPIIMSDWLHQSVWNVWDASVAKGFRIPIDNILQNGIGHWPPLDSKGLQTTATKPQFNEVFFQKGVRYLMRLINGGDDTTFVFSIDNHKFWVISTDFVSIEPYLTDHVVVGIGQRYNIIVEARPEKLTPDENFWLRTSPAPNCTSWNSSRPIPDEHTGILRYTFNDRLPTTSRNPFNVTCSDETYWRNITPIVPWEVSKKRHELDPLYLNFNPSIKGSPYYPCNKPNGHFELVPGHPMWLNFSDATLLNLNQDFSLKPWLAEVDTGKVDKDAWIQMTIISGAKRSGSPTLPHPVPKKPGVFVPSQHPIHLHGHDFAVLDQCVPEPNTEECDIDRATLNLHNPPRRDVVFLPDKGYLIIAFRADNPGVWIMHCHIAFHASMGLATQVIENKALIPGTFGFGWDEPLMDMCKQWDSWLPEEMSPSDPCMLKHPDVEPLQEDSGI